MKKIIHSLCFMAILLSVALTAFAGSIPEDFGQNVQLESGVGNISLEKLLGVAQEDAEEIKIHYNREFHEIDVDEFYKAIDGIVLTDIENVPLARVDGEKASLPNGMYITVNGFDGYAFISDDCMVDKCGMHFSRIPVGAYTMKAADRARIIRLFADGEDKLPFLATPLAGEMLRWCVIAICIFAIAFAIGFTVKKKRN